MPYFLIYALVAAGIFICFLDDTPVRRAAQSFYFVVVLISLAGFAGMRSPAVDRDFQEYDLWFNAIKSGAAPPLAWMRDPAFAIISYIFSRLALPYSAVAFFYAALGLIATWKFARAAFVPRWATLFFYLLFCQYYIVLEMTQIRAAVAIPLMAGSLYLACEGRRRHAIGLYLIALVFHFSVIVALPLLVMILVGVRFRSRAWLFSLVVAGAVAAVAMTRIIDFISGLYRLSEFLNGGAEENDLRVISWYALAHLFTLAVAALILWKNLNLHQRMATLACGIGLTLFLLFGWNTGLATRFLYLFDLYWLLIMMMVLEKLKGEARILYVTLLIFVGFGLYCKSLQYVDPYSTFKGWDAILHIPYHRFPVHAMRLPL